MSSVDLQMPIPGPKKCNSFLRQTFPWATMHQPCAGLSGEKVLYLALLGRQRHRQGLPPKASHLIEVFFGPGKSKANLKN